MTEDSIMTIFAHQDDETFSAGGILAKYADVGTSYAVSVTRDDKRIKEFNQACEILGAKPILLDYPQISAHNELDIRRELIEIIAKYKPNHIITHIDMDYHHEHRRVRKNVEEAVEWVSHTTGDIEAFQVRSLWAAETTILIPFPEIYVDITAYNPRRMEAISVYESQSHKGGKGFYSEFHGTRTKLRGIQAGVGHAEAFVQIPIAQTGSFKPTKVYNKLPY